MFTEGLDESAIEWIKKGSDGDTQLRSPLAERFSIGTIPQSPSLRNSKNYLSSPILPPLKFHSGLLMPQSAMTLGLNDDDDESVASVNMDTGYSDESEEEDLGSSDHDLQDKPIVQRYDEELFVAKSISNFNRESGKESDGPHGSTMIRGSSKEKLRIEVPDNIRRFRGGDLGIRECAQQNSNQGGRDQPREQGSHMDGVLPDKLVDLGTPSAPPIMEIDRGESNFEVTSQQWSSPTHLMEMEQTIGEINVPSQTKACFGSQETPTDSGTQSQTSNEPCASYWQTNSMDQPIFYSTSGQNAWQVMISYDACIRLCLYAWARGCTEAPEFLRDECQVLRSAFGLHKFLLQPRSVYPKGGFAESTEEKGTLKATKVVGKIRVEVKKIRVVPRRKLKMTYSQRGAFYVQAGTDYVRHVSGLLRTGISSLRLTPLSVASEEALSCLFRLKSSTEEIDVEPGSAICLHPGTGDSHVFFPESQGDALLIEVQDMNKVIQGRATIQISSLTENTSDRVRWWPIYHDDHECVGKVQLSIGSTITCDDTNPTKSGPVVETLAYDFVLEAALRAQHFHPRNLRLHGPWRWLLNEFADYYGVSDSYTKLRYLSYVMNVATPTKNCLELVHELLAPVIKARGEKSLTRQEKSILLDCETQVENLLANVFENYKSLDELTPTGLADLFGPILECAAPALVPAVTVYTLLHDILAQEAQTILRNYLQKAATKRCRRHMMETDEFMSSNTEGFHMDSMTISTAYLKMKNLCINISNEIQADIKIHNQHILPSSIDLSNIAAGVYSTELCNRLRGFLAAWPPSSPSPHVTELLIATADFERDLQSWNISPVHGGIDSRNLFHDYIMIWVEDWQLSMLDLCKAEKVPWNGVSTNHSTSPFAENMYEKIKDALSEYEVVINRWPQYSLILENAVTNIERAVMKALEKQYSEILMPLKDSIPKKLGMHVQKLTRRQSTTLYSVPTQLGTFLNTIKRILDVLHCRVENILKPWASCLPINGEKKSIFGEQMNGITVMLRTKYKNYMQATVEKLILNTQANRSTRLKRILEETKEEDGEADVRERMQMLSSQLIDSITNLHEVFSSWIFVAICRGFWDKMGQTVLKFLESRKENRIWYNGSYYALGILDDTFASQMQRLQGNALQPKDLEPPRSVIEARSVLCRDTRNTTDPSNYFYV
ncbi:uncharacterized protein LOC122649572 isoform X2 [Telopea speciosissima]|uniref:uncharacterized protein LOC122649572 isoform X2 n=1 Tax=Telopea speciosissima TaxID=54955 RepID=UPI001CC701CD|nr:uncharacterized protein LOC122649572 isoform X2 [Telopea speciosissima]